MDGTAAFRLAEGSAFALSADGKSVVASSWPGDKLFIVPTGVGEIKTLPSGAVEKYDDAAFFPNSHRVVFVGKERGHNWRCYIQDPGGMPHAITPEGITPGDWLRLTTDGRFIVMQRPHGLSLYRIEGGDEQMLRGAAPGDVPIQWSADGRFMFVRGAPRLPANIYRLELSTGHRELWKQVSTIDAAGLLGVGPIMITSDGKSHVYGIRRNIDKLYLVEGLK
jgi:hypothetical protein